jgi:hypothetical protein
MSEPRCERTELLVSACACCRPKPAPPLRAERDPELAGLDFGDDVGPEVLAQYDGRCACGCGEEIESGLDRIVRTADGWVLAGCARPGG